MVNRKTEGKMMKKLVLPVTMCALTLGIATAFLFFAPQGGQTAYACEVPVCQLPEEHTHSVCDLADCLSPVNHEHDGILYFAHYENDGHDYHIAVSASVSDPTDASPPPLTGGKPTLEADPPSASLEVPAASADISPSPSPTPPLLPSPLPAVTPFYYDETPLPTCVIDACTLAGEHYHVLCAVAGCTVATDHRHDGIFYHGHYVGDGHAYHTCGANGCGINARHSHGGNGGHHGNGHH
jgi:hypothetical protein